MREGQVTDRAKYAMNAERIFGKVHPPIRSGPHVMVGDTLVHIDDLNAIEAHLRIRARDATNQDSVAMGCALSQIPEMNRRFGHLGVKFIPNPKHGHTAVCRWKDRQSRLAFMGATGRHCFEEVHG